MMGYGRTRRPVPLVLSRTGAIRQRSLEQPQHNGAIASGIRPRIKVLHLINTLALGGAEANLLNLVEATDAKQVEVTVAYSFGGTLETRFRECGIPLWKYANRQYKVKHPYSIVIIYRLWRYIRSHGIGIVHTHNYNGHVWGAIAAKIAGVRVIEHVHDPRYDDPNNLRRRGVAHPEQFAQARYFAKLSDRIVVLNQEQRQRLMSRFGVSDQKIRVQPNGIPIPTQATHHSRGLKAELSIAPDERIVLFVGRLSIEKNPELVITIARCVQGRLPGIVFLMAGEGPERINLERQIYQAGLEGYVRLLGFRPDTHALMGIADLLIQPSLRELHSLVMIEAMSLGLVVLASRGVGNNEECIVDGINGFLLDPNDATAWAEQIVCLLTNEPIRQTVGEEGKRRVIRDYDIHHTARAFERLYEELATGVSQNGVR